jgi:hypothetical protein
MQLSWCSSFGSCIRVKNRYPDERIGHEENHHGLDIHSNIIYEILLKYFLVSNSPHRPCSYSYAPVLAGLLGKDITERELREAWQALAKSILNYQAT